MSMKHYSVAYISRRFKQETGVTLREYVQNVRIEKSCELLEDSDLRVVEIARRVGYEDIKFFNRFLSGGCRYPRGNTGKSA